jgi:hypothetical protein
MSSGYEVGANEVQVKLPMCKPRKANREMEVHYQLFLTFVLDIGER